MGERRGDERVAWTYSGNPSSSTRDQVRFELGDTDKTDQQLFDAEVDYLITQFVDPYYAAAGGCDALAAKMSRQAQKSIGGLSIAANNRADAYRKRACELRDKAARVNGLSGIGIGGQSIADKAAAGLNSDQVQPQFQIGMDDTTGTATVSSSNPLLGSY